MKQILNVDVIIVGPNKKVLACIDKKLLNCGGKFEFCIKISLYLFTKTKNWVGFKIVNVRTIKKCCATATAIERCAKLYCNCIC